MDYRWKPGTRLTVDAAIIGIELERLSRENDGKLTPELLVQEAASQLSPMHGCFEWEDRHAAQLYRVTQARYLLRSIEVVIEREEQPLRSRAFVNVVQNRGEAKAERVYVSIEYALTNDDWRAQVFNKAIAEIIGWRRRYRDYQELADIFLAVDTVLVGYGASS